MLYLPLRIFVAYLVVTLLIALFGPISYYGFNDFAVSLYMALIIGGILVGYNLGIRSGLPVAPEGFRPSMNLHRVLKVSLGLALIGLTASFISFARTGDVNWDLSALGSAYVEGYEGYERGSGEYDAGFILYTLSSPFVFIASILGMYYFRRLSKAEKVLVALVTFGSASLFTVTSGKQKYLGDLIIYLLAISLVKWGVSGRTFSWKIILAIASVAVVGLTCLVLIIGQRYAAISIDLFNINAKASRLMRIDIDHPLFAFLGPNLGFSSAAFLGYLSQGYFGLSLSLDTDTTWSFLLGSSYSASVIGERVFGLPSAYENSYPFIAGMETGWGESHWYTVFPWFASDVSFMGTIPLFGFFAFVYARTWKESVIHENPMAILLFSLLTLGAFFMPANNQLAHSPGPLFTLILTVYLYIRYHREFNRTAVQR